MASGAPDPLVLDQAVPPQGDPRERVRPGQQAPAFVDQALIDHRVAARHTVRAVGQLPLLVLPLTP